MRIASVALRNFKRFTDFVIRDIPATAKLVVVVGPNGCGKSSLFDAFLQWYRSKLGFGHTPDDLYYRKDRELPFAWNNSVTVQLHGDVQPTKGCLYVRTAYRNDPDFTLTSLQQPDEPSQTVRINRVIDNDQTVAANYQRLVYDTMSELYSESNDAKTVKALRDELIGRVRDSMSRVFGDLLLNNIIDPLGSGAFYFEKGTAKRYHYKNLSGGEKAAFDLLLDLHVKQKYFPDAIFCIDEMETHLHTRLQGKMLRELAAILPETSQLWITTHSLGVLRAAQEMALAAPGSVCVIDFDGLEPDGPHELVPSNLGRVSWEKMLSIALDDLSQRVAPTHIVVCEGSAAGTSRRDFDAEIYSRILGTVFPEVAFVSGGASTQVHGVTVSVAQMLRGILPTAKVVAIVDRDDQSDEEVRRSAAAGGLTLPRRHLESYLFADDVIEALLVKYGKSAQLAEAMELTRQAVANSVARGNPSDDLKSAAGEIYNGLKKLLALQRCGNNADAFMRDTLAPLVVAPMVSYEALKAAIIDQLPP